MSLNKKTNTIQFRILTAVILLVFITTSTPAHAQFAPLSFFHPPTSGALMGKNLRLPESTGRVEEVFEGRGEPFVVFVQDAHAHFEAQKHIADILTHLRSNYSVRSIGMEGMEGPVDLTFFRSLPYPEIKNKILENDMRSGGTAGVDYFAMTAVEDIQLTGLDQTRLYLENVKQYADIFGKKNEHLKTARSLKETLRALRPRTYSRGTREISGLYLRFARGHMEMTEFLRRLFPLLDRYKLPLPEDSEIFKLGPLFRNQGREKEVLEEMDRLIGRLDTAKLSVEVNDFLMRFLASSANSEKERELLAFDAFAVLLEKGIRLELSRKEAVQLKMLSSKSMSFPGEAGNDIEKLTQEILAFYDTVHLRDQAFAENIRQHMKNSREKVIAFVAGGFHTEGVTEELKKKKISFAVVRPAMTEDRKSDIYEKQMVSWGSRLRKYSTARPVFHYGMYATDDFQETVRINEANQRYLVNRIIEPYMRAVLEREGVGTEQVAEVLARSSGGELFIPRGKTVSVVFSLRSFLAALKISGKFPGANAADLIAAVALPLPNIEPAKASGFGAKSGSALKEFKTQAAQYYELKHEMLKAADKEDSKGFLRTYDEMAGMVEKLSQSVMKVSDENILDTIKEISLSGIPLPLIGLGLTKMENDPEGRRMAAAIIRRELFSLGERELDGPTKEIVTKIVDEVVEELYPDPKLRSKWRETLLSSIGTFHFRRVLTRDSLEKIINEHPNDWPGIAPVLFHNLVMIGAGEAAVFPMSDAVSVHNGVDEVRMRAYLKHELVHYLALKDEFKIPFDFEPITWAVMLMEFVKHSKSTLAEGELALDELIPEFKISALKELYQKGKELGLTGETGFLIRPGVSDRKAGYFSIDFLISIARGVYEKSGISGDALLDPYGAQSAAGIIMAGVLMGLSEKAQKEEAEPVKPLALLRDFFETLYERYGEPSEEDIQHILGPNGLLEELRIYASRLTGRRVTMEPAAEGLWEYIPAADPDSVDAKLRFVITDLYRRPYDGVNHLDTKGQREAARERGLAHIILTVNRVLHGKRDLRDLAKENKGERSEFRVLWDTLLMPTVIASLTLHADNKAKTLTEMAAYAGAPAWIARMLRDRYNIDNKLVADALHASLPLHLRYLDTLLYRFVHFDGKAESLADPRVRAKQIEDTVTESAGIFGEKEKAGWAELMLRPDSLPEDETFLRAAEQNVWPHYLKLFEEAMRREELKRAYERLRREDMKKQFDRAFEQFTGEELEALDEYFNNLPEDVKQAIQKQAQEAMDKAMDQFGKGQAEIPPPPGAGIPQPGKPGAGKPMPGGAGQPQPGTRPQGGKSSPAGQAKSLEELAGQLEGLENGVDRIEQELDKLSGKIGQIKQDAESVGSDAKVLPKEGERKNEAKSIQDAAHSLQDQVQKLSDATRSVESGSRSQAGDTSDFKNDLPSPETGANAEDLSRELADKAGALRNKMEELQKAANKLSKASDRLAEELGKPARDIDSGKAKGRADAVGEEAESMSKKADEVRGPEREISRTIEELRQKLAELKQSLAKQGTHAKSKQTEDLLNDLQKAMERAEAAEDGMSPPRKRGSSDSDSPVKPGNDKGVGQSDQPQAGKGEGKHLPTPPPSARGLDQIVGKAGKDLPASTGTHLRAKQIGELSEDELRRAREAEEQAELERTGLDENQRREYETYKNPVENLIREATEVLEKLLIPTIDPEIQKRLRRGPLLDVVAAGIGEEDPWGKRQFARPRRLILTVLIDRSGSMGGEKILAAKIMFVALLEIIFNLNQKLEAGGYKSIEFEVGLYEDSEDPQLQISHQTVERDVKPWQHERLIYSMLKKIEAGGGTNATRALNAYVERIKQRILVIDESREDITSLIVDIGDRDMGDSELEELAGIANGVAETNGTLYFPLSIGEETARKQTKRLGEMLKQGRSVIPKSFADAPGDLIDVLGNSILPSDSGLTWRHLRGFGVWVEEKEWSRNINALTSVTLSAGFGFIDVIASFSNIQKAIQRRPEQSKYTLSRRPFPFQVSFGLQKTQPMKKNNTMPPISPARMGVEKAASGFGAKADEKAKQEDLIPFKNYRHFFLKKENGREFLVFRKKGVPEIRWERGPGGAEMPDLTVPDNDSNEKILLEMLKAVNRPNTGHSLTSTDGEYLIRYSSGIELEAAKRNEAGEYKIFKKVSIYEKPMKREKGTGDDSEFTFFENKDALRWKIKMPTGEIASSAKERGGLAMTVGQIHIASNGKFEPVLDWLAEFSSPYLVETGGVILAFDFGSPAVGIIERKDGQWHFKEMLDLNLADTETEWSGKIVELEGETGVGKGTLLRAAATLMNEEIFFIAGNEEMSREDLRNYRTLGQKQAGVSGRKESFMARTQHYGGWVIIDEINKIKPHVINDLKSDTAGKKHEWFMPDEKGIFRSRTVSNHPRARIFSTRNPQRAGVQSVASASSEDQALQRRKRAIQVGWLEPNDEVEMQFEYAKEEAKRLGIYKENWTDADRKTYEDKLHDLIVNLVDVSVTLRLRFMGYDVGQQQKIRKNWDLLTDLDFKPKNSLSNNLKRAPSPRALKNMIRHFMAYPFDWKYRKWTVVHHYFNFDAEIDASQTFRAAQTDFAARGFADDANAPALRLAKDSFQITPDGRLKIVPVRLETDREKSAEDFWAPITLPLHPDARERLENGILPAKLLYWLQSPQNTLAFYHSLQAVSLGRHLIFVGEQETGKSTLGEIIAELLSGPELLIQPVGVETAREDLIFGKHIGEEGRAFESGWLPGSVPQAMNTNGHGKTLLMEETPQGKPGVIAVLNEVSERGYLLDPRTDQPVRKAEGFSIIHLINPPGIGIQVKAFSDEFLERHHIESFSALDPLESHEFILQASRREGRQVHTQLIGEMEVDARNQPVLDPDGEVKWKGLLGVERSIRKLIKKDRSKFPRAPGVGTFKDIVRHLTDYFEFDLAYSGKLPQEVLLEAFLKIFTLKGRPEQKAEWRRLVKQAFKENGLWNDPDASGVIGEDAVTKFIHGADDPKLRGVDVITTVLKASRMPRTGDRDLDGFLIFIQEHVTEISVAWRLEKIKRIIKDLSKKEKWLDEPFSEQLKNVFVLKEIYQVLDVVLRERGAKARPPRHSADNLATMEQIKDSIRTLLLENDWPVNTWQSDVAEVDEWQRKFTPIGIEQIFAVSDVIPAKAGIQDKPITIEAPKAKLLEILFGKTQVFDSDQPYVAQIIELAKDTVNDFPHDLTEWIDQEASIETKKKNLEAHAKGLGRFKEKLRWSELISIIDAQIKDTEERIRSIDPYEAEAARWTVRRVELGKRRSDGAGFGAKADEITTAQLALTDEFIKVPNKRKALNEKAALLKNKQTELNKELRGETKASRQGSVKEALTLIQKAIEASTQAEAELNAYTQTAEALYIAYEELRSDVIPAKAGIQLLDSPVKPGHDKGELDARIQTLQSTLAKQKTSSETLLREAESLSIQADQAILQIPSKTVAPPPSTQSPWQQLPEDHKYSLLMKYFIRAHKGKRIRKIISFDIGGAEHVLSVGDGGDAHEFLSYDNGDIFEDESENNLAARIRKKHKGTDTLDVIQPPDVKGKPRFLSVGTNGKVYEYGPQHRQPIGSKFGNLLLVTIGGMAGVIVFYFLWPVFRERGWSTAATVLPVFVAIAAMALASAIVELYSTFPFPPRSTLAHKIEKEVNKFGYEEYVKGKKKSDTNMRKLFLTAFVIPVWPALFIKAYFVLQAFVAAYAVSIPFLITTVLIFSDTAWYTILFRTKSRLGYFEKPRITFIEILPNQGFPDRNRVVASLVSPGGNQRLVEFAQDSKNRWIATDQPPNLLKRFINKFKTQEVKAIDGLNPTVGIYARNLKRVHGEEQILGVIDITEENETEVRLLSWDDDEDIKVWHPDASGELASVYPYEGQDLFKLIGPAVEGFDSSGRATEINDFWFIESEEGKVMLVVKEITDAEYEGSAYTAAAGFGAEEKLPDLAAVEAEHYALLGILETEPLRQRELDRKKKELESEVARLKGESPPVLARHQNALAAVTEAFEKLGALHQKRSDLHEIYEKLEAALEKSPVSSSSESGWRIAPPDHPAHGLAESILEAHPDRKVNAVIRLPYANHTPNEDIRNEMFLSVGVKAVTHRYENEKWIADADYSLAMSINTDFNGEEILGVKIYEDFQPTMRYLVFGARGTVKEYYQFSPSAQPTVWVGSVPADQLFEAGIRTSLEMAVIKLRLKPDDLNVTDISEISFDNGNVIRYLVFTNYPNISFEYEKRVEDHVFSPQKVNPYGQQIQKPHNTELLVSGYIEIRGGKVADGERQFISWGAGFNDYALYGNRIMADGRFGLIETRFDDGIIRKIRDHMTPVLRELHGRKDPMKITELAGSSPRYLIQFGDLYAAEFRVTPDGNVEFSEDIQNLITEPQKILNVRYGDYGVLLNLKSDSAGAYLFAEPSAEVDDAAEKEAVLALAREIEEAKKVIAEEDRLYAEAGARAKEALEHLTQPVEIPVSQVKKHFSPWRLAETSKGGEDEKWAKFADEVKQTGKNLGVQFHKIIHFKDHLGKEHHLSFGTLGSVVTYEWSSRDRQWDSWHWHRPDKVQAISTSGGALKADTGFANIIQLKHKGSDIYDALVFSDFDGKTRLVTMGAEGKIFEFLVTDKGLAILPNVNFPDQQSLIASEIQSFIESARSAGHISGMQDYEIGFTINGVKEIKDFDGNSRYLFFVTESSRSGETNYALELLRDDSKKVIGFSDPSFAEILRKQHQNQFISGIEEFTLPDTGERRLLSWGPSVDHDVEGTRFHEYLIAKDGLIPLSEKGIFVADRDERAFLRDKPQLDKALSEQFSKVEQIWNLGDKAVLAKGKVPAEDTKSQFAGFVRDELPEDEISHAAEKESDDSDGGSSVSSLLEKYSDPSIGNMLLDGDDAMNGKGFGIASPSKITAARNDTRVSFPRKRESTVLDSPVKPGNDKKVSVPVLLAGRYYYEAFTNDVLDILAADKSGSGKAFIAEALAARRSSDVLERYLDSIREKIVHVLGAQYWIFAEGGENILRTLLQTHDQKLIAALSLDSRFSARGGPAHQTPFGGRGNDIGRGNDKGTLSFPGLTGESNDIGMQILLLHDANDARGLNILSPQLRERLAFDKINLADRSLNISTLRQKIADLGFHGEPLAYFLDPAKLRRDFPEALDPAQAEHFRSEVSELAQLITAYQIARQAVQIAA